MSTLPAQLRPRPSGPIPQKGLERGIFNQFRVTGCQKQRREVAVLRILRKVGTPHQVEFHLMPISSWQRIMREKP